MGSLKACPGEAIPVHAQGLLAPPSFEDLFSQPHHHGISAWLTWCQLHLQCALVGGKGCFQLHISQMKELKSCCLRKPQTRGVAVRGWACRVPSRYAQLSLTGKPLCALQLALSSETVSVASFMLVVKGLAPCGSLTIGSLKALEISLLLNFQLSPFRPPSRQCHFSWHVVPPKLVWPCGLGNAPFLWHCNSSG